MQVLQLSSVFADGAQVVGLGEVRARAKSRCGIPTVSPLLLQALELLHAKGNALVLPAAFATPAAGGEGGEGGEASKAGSGEGRGNGGRGGGSAAGSGSEGVVVWDSLSLWWAARAASVFLSLPAIFAPPATTGDASPRPGAAPSLQ